MEIKYLKLRFSKKDSVWQMFRKSNVKRRYDYDSNITSLYKSIDKYGAECTGETEKKLKD